MTLSVKPPNINKQRDSVTAPVETASVKPPNAQVQPIDVVTAQAVSVKPPNK